MRVHLVNPSDISFGVAVITPRWLYVLAAATPEEFGDPQIVDETLEPLDPATINKGDLVGIGIHSTNALAGYAAGRKARERGATVVFGGIHATLYPDEAYDRGGAHAVVTGDGDQVWQQVLRDASNGGPKKLYAGGRLPGGQMIKARWDLMPPDSYMWASVQTVRGCPKHCSFCSVWRTDGQRPRQFNINSIVEEVVVLRRKGFRFIALADDNFYPVTLGDIEKAERKGNQERLNELKSIREERFELMRRLGELPGDLIFFTQITMEAAEDSEFLKAMRKANIRGALVGIESVTPKGLKDIFKDFNLSGDALVEQLQKFRKHDLHVLGSFIFGLQSDTPSTFDATAELALKADLTFAQFVALTPFPGTVDFERWEKNEDSEKTVEGVPLNRYWLIPGHKRPKLYTPHPKMSGEEMRSLTQGVWSKFYSFQKIWKRSRCAGTIRARLAFVLVSKLYRQMYAGTGIATDSARRTRARNRARWIARPLRRLFMAKPMPGLQIPPDPVQSVGQKLRVTA